MELAQWAQSHREQIEEFLHTAGAVLFRGFGLREAAQFESFVATLYPRLVVEHERSSPRHRVAGNVFTSTDHPADQEIFLHNELSYSNTWPMRLGFFCVTSPLTEGETPIADTRQVLRELSPEVVRRFSDKGVMYVRNYGDGYGLPWQVSFQTGDRAEVERYCGANGMVAEWKDRDRLRTRRIGPAMARHPVTGVPVWFNHATFFHVSTLEPVLRDALSAEHSPEDLPTNTFYGDRSPIDPDVLDELRAAYRRATVKFPWQEGDVLLIDNMLVSHGRSPFTGPRKVVVTMADPVTEAQTALDPSAR